MTAFLVNGGLVFICLGLLAGGLGAPIPEDPFLVAAGVLANGEGYSYAAWTLFVVLAAVLVGDTILYWGVRRLGPGLLERPLIKKVLPPERMKKINGLSEKHGGRIIFLARFVAGFRSAVFILAALNKMPFHRFMFWDVLGALISVPLAVAVGYFGAEYAKRFELVQHALVGFAIAGLLALAIHLFLNRRAKGET